MSSAEALRRCPEAVFVRPDFERYRARSREVWALVKSLVPRVEQVGIDEGYLDLSDVTGDAGEAHRRCAEVQSRVLEETGLTCSLGCGTSKTVAKIASDRRKPHGLVIVPPGEEAEFLAPLPLRLLPGVGPRSEERFARAGVRTIGDLARLSDGSLDALSSGKVGRELRARARGDDPRVVDPEPAAPVSQGSEETFERDLVSLSEMEGQMRRLAAGLWAHLERKELRARTATAKLRYDDFQIVTRSQTLRDPIASGEELEALVVVLLRRALDDRGDPVRLLGVYVSGLEAADAPGQLRLPAVG
jgi:DNA polymerase-4